MEKSETMQSANPSETGKMTKSDILTHIDHTCLSPTATYKDINTLCEEAQHYHVASVCIQEYYVRYARSHFPDLRIGTVIGFPLGYSEMGTKIAEASEAMEAGADEIDMVINLCMVKNGEFDRIEWEIDSIRNICLNGTLKVIVEACYLDEAEKIKLCNIVTRAKADFIKTSTGFGPGGASVADVELFRKHIGPNVQIKAAGGISTFAAAEGLIRAGASRIGSSKLIQIYRQNHEAFNE